MPSVKIKISGLKTETSIRSLTPILSPPSIKTGAPRRSAKLRHARAEDNQLVEDEEEGVEEDDD